MPGAQTIDPQASERLASVASSVPLPFGEHDTSSRALEYESMAKAIGERLASGVIFDGQDQAVTPGDLLEAIAATAGSMLMVDNPNYPRFINDEAAVAYAGMVYQTCVGAFALGQA